jgi:hypothetical protein
LIKINSLFFNSSVHFITFFLLTHNKDLKERSIST